MKRKIDRRTETTLTAKERKGYKTHQVERIRFSSEHMNARYFIYFIPSWIMSLAAIIISIVQLLK